MIWKSSLFAALLCCAAPAQEMQSPEAPSLDQQVKAKIQGFHGKVTLYAKNLQT
jgi:hypothetical protein